MEGTNLEGLAEFKNLHSEIVSSSDTLKMHSTEACRNMFLRATVREKLKKTHSEFWTLHFPPTRETPTILIVNKYLRSF